MNIIVFLKHFIWDNSSYHPKKIYDHDEQIIFNYENNTLRIKGSSWSKECEIDDVAKIINNYFKSTNYVIIDIQRQLS